MQVGQAQVTRQERYDRSPKPIIQKYNGAVAAHGLTERMTYTVPANRILTLSTLNLLMHRITAGTAGFLVYFQVTIWDDLAVSLGTQQYTFVIDNLFEDKGVDVPVDIPLPAGYKISVHTLDSGAGGLVRYSLNMMGSEYDA